MHLLWRFIRSYSRRRIKIFLGSWISLQSFVLRRHIGVGIPGDMIVRSGGRQLFFVFFRAAVVV